MELEFSQAIWNDVKYDCFCHGIGAHEVLEMILSMASNGTSARVLSMQVATP